MSKFLLAWLVTRKSTSMTFKMENTRMNTHLSSSPVLTRNMMKMPYWRKKICILTMDQHQYALGLSQEKWIAILPEITHTITNQRFSVQIRKGSRIMKMTMKAKYKQCWQQLHGVRLYIRLNWRMMSRKHSITSMLIKVIISINLSCPISPSSLGMPLLTNR